MNRPSRLEFFLEEIPTWPLEGKTPNVVGASIWIGRLSDLLADYSFTEKILVVKKKTTGKAKIWVQRWELAHFFTGFRWDEFLSDFIQEANVDRSRKEFTWVEITSMKQGVVEPTETYKQRMILTLQLLPDDTDIGASNEYNMSSPDEANAALCFCGGLRENHQFKLEYEAASPTLKETFETVMALSYHDNAMFIGNIPQMVSPTVILGNHKISREWFSRFEKDFPPKHTENLTVEELAEMFSAWTLAEKLPHSVLRIDETIKKMNPTLARRVFGHTELAKHLRAEHVVESVPPVQSAFPRRAHNPRQGRNKGGRTHGTESSGVSFRFD